MKYLPLLLLLFFLSNGVLAATPVGHVDTFSDGKISGWVTDSDYNGPIPIHIYVEGNFFDAVTAKRNVSGKWYFDSGYFTMGPNYEYGVTVFAIDLDAAGRPTGNNVPLGNSTIKRQCSHLEGSERSWCDGVGNAYWTSRQVDTKILANDNIKIGINASLGGTITQLYSTDRTQNLIEEHGGSAAQLSIYANDISKGTEGAWFGMKSGKLSYCDKTPYSSESACKSAGNDVCQLLAKTGDQIADCSNIVPCNAVSAGFPWNPIQAQASGCAWLGPSNDVDVLTQNGNSIYIKKTNPQHFSKSAVGKFTGVTFEQNATLGDTYAKVDYTVKYAGNYQTGVQYQEFPAFFTGSRINRKFYYFDSNIPFTKSPNVIFHTPSDFSTSKEVTISLTNKNIIGRAIGTARERWWGACDSSETHCVTLATFSPLIVESNIKAHTETSGYLTPMGYFGLSPNSTFKSTVYMFPYKYSDVVDGKSIRDRIYDIAADVNNDGKKSQADVDLFASMMINGSLENYNLNTRYIDFNTDGKLGLADFVLLLGLQ